LTDSCTGSTHSPDVQSHAVDCAARETEAVVKEFHNTIYNAGVRWDELGQTEGSSTHWPKRGEACEFLSGAKNWNGQDVRWNSPLVVDSLREQYLKALFGSATSINFCSLSPSVMGHQNPAPSVDTSAGPQWCLKLNVFCVGKGDAPDEIPPWADAHSDTNPEASLEEAEPTPEAQACSMPARSTGSGAMAWLIVLAVTLLRAASRCRPPVERRRLARRRAALLRGRHKRRGLGIRSACRMA
jgi:hypothetical protein